MPTIGTVVDEEWICAIQKICGKNKEYKSISEYLRDLIRKDLAKRGLLKQSEVIANV